MKKNVLIVGGGGREHAIVWKLRRSMQVGKIYVAPGNAGTAAVAENVSIPATDIDGIVEFVKSHPDIYMTVVAPDDPLSMGLVNRLEDAGLRAFGPRSEAAIIESSKVFSKDLMKKYGIPTAAYETFDDYAAAKTYLETCKIPVVIKADGLALGKGVLICDTRQKAFAGLKEIMCDHAFGDAGKQVVIEEFLSGFEVSVLAFTDGETIVPMVSSQDHKRALDGDLGLNTGGMGTFSPSVKYTEEMAATAYDTIFVPTIRAMKAEGRTFKGVLYFGLMIDGSDIKVLEYNARFGDPETQVILPRLKNDLFDVFEACINGTLDAVKFDWSPEACVCVVAASGGYPLQYNKGLPVRIGDVGDCILFHAGTALKDGQLVTSGGRVLGVTALGKNLADARAKAYKGMEGVYFADMHYRKDICKLD